MHPSHGRSGWLSVLLFVLVSKTGLAAEKLPPRAVLGQHEGGVGVVLFTPDGQSLASAGGDKAVRVWDLATTRERHRFKATALFMCAALISPDGKVLFTGGYGAGTGPDPIRRWDLASGRELPSLKGQSSGVRRMLFHQDGKQLIWAGFDNNVRVWEVAGSRELRQMATPLSTNPVIALSPDGRALAGGGEGAFTCWDPDTGKPLSTFRIREVRSPSALAFSPDGRLLASGDNNCVRLWEVATGRELKRLVGYSNRVGAILFTPDGRRLYAGDYDHTLRLWDLPSGEEVCSFTGHTSWVISVALSPDRRTLVSGSLDGKIRVWDVARFHRPVPPRTAPLSKRAQEEAWTALADADPVRAWPAIWELASSPAQAVSLLEERLATACRPKLEQPERIPRLIAELDDDDFQTREKATAELARLGLAAERALRKVVASGAPEARRRARKLLANLRPDGLTRAELYAVRGVQVLEYVGTKEAQRLLEKLARGGPDERLTDEARTALQHLRSGKKR